MEENPYHSPTVLVEEGAKRETILSRLFGTLRVLAGLFIGSVAIAMFLVLAFLGLAFLIHVAVTSFPAF